jgi:hypothetical protein
MLKCETLSVFFADVGVDPFLRLRDSASATMPAWCSSNKGLNDKVKV